MKNRLLAVLVAVTFIGGGCATTGPRHTAAVGVLTSGSILDVIQDTEIKVVCGRSGAPQPPLCVDAELHHAISLKLSEAYKVHADLTLLIKAVPADQQPPEVATLLARVAQLVNDIVALIPSGSKQKTALVKQLAK